MTQTIPRSASFFFFKNERSPERIISGREIFSGYLLKFSAAKSNNKTVKNTGTFFSGNRDQNWPVALSDAIVLHQAKAAVFVPGLKLLLFSTSSQWIELKLLEALLV